MRPRGQILNDGYCSLAELNNGSLSTRRFIQSCNHGTVGDVRVLPGEGMRKETVARRVGVERQRKECRSSVVNGHFECNLVIWGTYGCTGRIQLTVVRALNVVLRNTGSEGCVFYLYVAVNMSCKFVLHSLRMPSGIVTTVLYVRIPVSYTHLDVYKRQPINSKKNSININSSLHITTRTVWLF